MVCRFSNRQTSCDKQQLSRKIPAPRHDHPAKPATPLTPGPYLLQSAESEK
jgi:hypothetical protein